MKKINKVLIANRGVIAKRIIRACREEGIYTIAIRCSTDPFINHYQEADEFYIVPNINDKNGYMNAEAILELASKHSASIHPGYGFLSENYEFAKACQDNNITFIGPKPEILEFCGNKAMCKTLLENHNIPTLPSITLKRGEIDADSLDNFINKNGFPLLIKPSYGGGGIGMTLVQDKTNLDDLINNVFDLAEKYFGDSEIILEKYLTEAKHIEVQLAGDKDHNLIHLFDRECSLQRRRQKVVEEAPSPSLSSEKRSELYELALKIGQVLELDNIATVEFLYQNNNFYFLEINPRLQVEHSVTEEITGIDLVKLQISLSEGRKLDLKPEIRGHAIQARIYAESPFSFLPAPGKITYLSLPEGKGIRIESSIYKEMEVSDQFDPLLMKLITSAASRPECIKKIANAINDTDINGSLETNLMAIKKAISQPEFIEGSYKTNFLEQQVLKDEEFSLYEDLAQELAKELKIKPKINSQFSGNSGFWQPSFWNKA